MVANIIDGKRIALNLKNSLKLKVDQRIEKNLAVPQLAVILVGQDPASKTYVQAKRKACEYVGIISIIHELPDSLLESELIQLIISLNAQANINGILIQLPLPQHINKQHVLDHVDSEKDVDGFHPYNLGRLCQRRPLFRPCTPKGVMHLLAETGIALQGRDALVIGASDIVGRPMALELLLSACTVSIAHRFTQNLENKVNQADIVIVAVGQPNLIKGEWLKKGAIVIDIGINRLEDGSLSGDVEFDTAVLRASWITPVPGGVGPMTVACLLENTWDALCQQEEKNKACIE